MLKRFFNKLSLPQVTLPTVKISIPKVRLPNISFPDVKLPEIKLPRIVFPFRKMGEILGAINTTLLVLLGSIGLLVSYINPIPTITPYISLSVAVPFS